jgi:hypothetical protein
LPEINAEFIMAGINTTLNSGIHSPCLHATTGLNVRAMTINSTTPALITSQALVSETALSRTIPAINGMSAAIMYPPPCTFESTCLGGCSCVIERDDERQREEGADTCAKQQG